MVPRFTMKEPEWMLSTTLTFNTSRMRSVRFNAKVKYLSPLKAYGIRVRHNGSCGESATLEK